MLGLKLTGRRGITAAGIILSLGLLGLGSQAGADDFDRLPQGFVNNSYASIAMVEERGRDGQFIELQGRLTRYLGGERYEFADQRGDTIEVKLDDDDDWSYLRKDQLIKIIGKLDKDLFFTRIIVKRAQPLEP